MHNVTKFLVGFLTWLRDVYVGLLVIPLWLWSAYYRIDPSFKQFPHIAWIEHNWNLLCILSFTHGALALWQYADKLMVARLQQRSTKVLAGSVWALAITLFVMGIGALLKSNGIAWGYGLVAMGTIGLPLFVFWIYGFTVYLEKNMTQKPYHRRPRCFPKPTLSLNLFSNKKDIIWGARETCFPDDGRNSGSLNQHDFPAADSHYSLN